MTSLGRVLLPAIVVACSALAPSALRASACNQEIVVPIRFEPGAKCWRHTGTGTTFNGSFGANQHVTATAMGANGPWQLYLSGPNGFSVSDGGDGRLNIVLPANGKYSFSIGPCAEWGAPGTVEICAQ